MDRSKSLYVADWEIMYKLPNKRHEFFYAENCTESKAWYRFEAEVPRELRGRSLHIVECTEHPSKRDEWWEGSDHNQKEEPYTWKHPFKSYPDKAA